MLKIETNIQQPTGLFRVIEQFICIRTKWVLWHNIGRLVGVIILENITRHVYVVVRNKARIYITRNKLCNR